MLLHFGRCGSSVLASLLEQNPNIRWDGELLHRYKHKSIPEEIIAKDAKSAMLLRQYRYGSKHWGMELKPLPFMHLSAAQLGMTTRAFIEFAISIGFNHFIFLERPNYLRKMVSTTIAVERGAYFSKNDERGITIDIDKTVYGYPLLELFNKLDAATDDVLDSTVSVPNGLLKLNYREHILPDPTIAYNTVCEFIGLDNSQIVQTSMKKVNPGSLIDLIKNFDEVAHCLTGTPYEWMLSGEE